MFENCALIPARGGSKGVPRKNIRMLAGKPLIAYSIEAALKSKHLNGVFVTTEDNEIAEISLKYGAKIINRPQELATDKTATTPVLLHAIESLNSKGIFPERIILLQPTSPLRTPQDIDQAIEKFKTSYCESLISVCKFAHSPYWSFRIDAQYIKPLFKEKLINPRRQNIETLYRPNGAIYISTIENLKKYGGFISEKTIPYIMNENNSIDIDEELDFQIAELILEKKGKI